MNRKVVAYSIKLTSHITNIALLNTNTWNGVNTRTPNRFFDRFGVRIDGRDARTDNFPFDPITTTSTPAIQNVLATPNVFLNELSLVFVMHFTKLIHFSS
jgi:hypothetical protein